MPPLVKVLKSGKDELGLKNVELGTARPKLMKPTKLARVILTLLSVDHWRPVGNVSWCELSLS